MGVTAAMERTEFCRLLKLERNRNNEIAFTHNRYLGLLIILCAGGKFFIPNEVFDTTVSLHLAP